MIVLAFAAAAFGQAVNPAKLKINGAVGLDSTYARVVKALGRPASETKPQKEECVGGREKTVKYAGLKLYFMDGMNMGGKTFEVMSFDVSSRKYNVSGVRVGDREAAVRQRFGSGYTSHTEKGVTRWTYNIDEIAGQGRTLITFRNGKVQHISSAYAIC